MTSILHICEGKHHNESWKLCDKLKSKCSRWEKEDYSFQGEFLFLQNLIKAWKILTEIL